MPRAYNLLMPVRPHLQPNGTEVSQLLVNVSSYTNVDQWDKYDWQTSAPLTLAAGQAVLLTASHCNKAGTGTFQVQQIGSLFCERLPEA